MTFGTVKGPCMRMHDSLSSTRRRHDVMRLRYICSYNSSWVTAHPQLLMRLQDTSSCSNLAAHGSCSFHEQPHS